MTPVQLILARGTIEPVFQFPDPGIPLGGETNYPHV